MSFPETELSQDGFLGGRVKLWQPLKGYRAATDPVLLAAAVPARPGQRVLDLGCGAGAAGLCLARRVSGLEVHGLEIQPAYAALAQRNAAENGLEMTVHQGDLLHPPAGLRRLIFDHVMMNPPFHPAISATASTEPGRDLAHREGPAGLTAWIAAALKRLAPRGQVTLIHKAGRLPEIVSALNGQAGGIAVLPLSARANHPAKRVIVWARKGSSAEFTLHPPLTIHKGSSHIRDENSYTDAVERVLRDMEELLPDARLGGNED